MTTPASTVNSTDFLSRATALVDRGFSVIPITPRGKSPIGPGATSHTREDGTILQWADRWPDANAAICADENVTILESDDADRLRKLLAEQGVELPVTLTGGASENRPHWFYKRTPACGDECVTVPGLFEFRNRNQYVVGPGSIHPSGADYKFWNDAAMVELPDAVIAALRDMADEYAGCNGGHGEHIQPGPYAKLRHAYLQRCEPEDLLKIDGLEVSEGERHYTLISLAGLLHDGERTADDIAEILQQVQSEYFSDSKGEIEVGNIADYAVREEPCNIEPRELPSFSFGTKVFSSQEALDAFVKTYADDYSIDWMLFAAQPIPEQKILMTLEDQPVLRQKMLTEIFAYRGIGKSALVASIIRCLTVGEPFLGFNSNGGNKVLLVDGELPDRLLQDRLKNFVGRIPLGSLRVHHLGLAAGGYIEPLANAVEQDKFFQVVAISKPDVIIFDTKTAIFQHDTNDQPSLLAVNKFLIKLRSMGKTVITLHHAGKNGTQRGRTDNDDNLDLVIKLTARRDWVPGMGLEFALDFDKVRYGDKLEGFDAKWSTAAGWERLENVDQEILGLLLKGEGANKVAKALGIGVERVMQAKRRAAKNGTEFPNARGPVDNKESKIELAKKLKAEGKSIKAIAAEVGASVGTVHNWLKAESVQH